MQGGELLVLPLDSTGVLQGVLRGGEEVSDFPRKLIKVQCLQGI